MGSTRLRAAVLAAVLVVLPLTACGPDPAQEGAPEAEPTASSSTPAAEHEHEHEEASLPATPKPSVKPEPLREGEWRETLAMPEAYTPQAPNGVGTDDYRCFLLDPGLEKDAYLTGTNILPGNPDVVHHVILFRVNDAAEAAAEAQDAAEEGPGWTCFGNMGFGEGVNGLEDAPWLGAWAPGGTERVNAPGFGTRIEKGTQVVMQVHYNLLAGASPDISALQMRFAPVSQEITPLHTMLMPAPVELGCRAGHDDSPLCDRAAAVADVKARFGNAAGSTADALHLLCGGKQAPSDTTSCTRTIGTPTTIRGVAGHMHLLGRQIKVEVNPGTPNARTVLDIPIWNFDDQGTRDIEPVRLQPWDTVKVTCKHVQWLRDELPAFETQREDRYVVWGEGTTDEMCLGILTVTRP